MYMSMCVCTRGMRVCVCTRLFKIHSVDKVSSCSKCSKAFIIKPIRKMHFDLYSLVTDVTGAPNGITLFNISLKE